MDIKLRNKEIKRILSKAFGRENVSVTNGKGTAWGWCHIDIDLPSKFGTTYIPEGDKYSKYTREACDLMNDVYSFVSFVIHDFEFYNYIDDMNYEQTEVLIQTRFKDLPIGIQF